MLQRKRKKVKKEKHILRGKKRTKQAGFPSREQKEKNKQNQSTIIAKKTENPSMNAHHHQRICLFHKTMRKCTRIQKDIYANKSTFVTYIFLISCR